MPIPTARRAHARRHAQRARMRGFTLTELFMVLAVAAVLALIAVPNLQEWVQNNSRTTRMNELVLAFNLARTEAIARRMPVTVCRAALPATACAAANTWHSGFVVRRDVNGDGDIADADDLIRVFDPDAGAEVTFLGSVFGGGAVTAVTYGATGQLAPTLDRARFVHCDARGAAAARAVVLSASGQPRISRDGADADLIHDVDGVNLTCP